MVVNQDEVTRLSSTSGAKNSQLRVKEHTGLCQLK